RVARWVLPGPTSKFLSFPVRSLDSCLSRHVGSRRARRIAVCVSEGVGGGGVIPTAEWPFRRQLYASLSGGGVPPPPWRGSSLDQTTRRGGQTEFLVN